VASEDLGICLAGLKKILRFVTDLVENFRSFVAVGLSLPILLFPGRSFIPCSYTARFPKSFRFTQETSNQHFTNCRR
jgi:hypothetical protein